MIEAKADAPRGVKLGSLRRSLVVAGLFGGGAVALSALSWPLAGLSLGGCAGALAAAWRQAGRLAEAGRAEMAELRRAREVAESASFAKSRYLADVSHDIRSPLNAIYGYAQLVERADDAGAAEAAGVIRRCAEHINTMVEALLDIAQVENGVLRVKTEVVNLDAFLDQILRMVRPAASAKGLGFAYAPQGRLPGQVRMDQGRLRQVLLNLLMNAVKYTEEGQVTLSVRHSGQIASFEVRDTGPGIRPEDQAAIFEAFKRGSAVDPQEAQPGAGLGLSISRTLTQIMGGELELVETGPQGTCFRLTLMLGEVAQTVATAPKPRRITGYRGSRRRVLIIDDEAEQRDLLTRLLGPLGFDITTAASGAAALDLCDMGRFDIAISDISMPGMNGWQTAAALRARMGDGIRILMLSANAQEFHRPEQGPELAEAPPAHDRFLVKPVAFAALLDTLGEMAGLAWVREDAESEPHTAVPAELGEAALVHVEKLRELLRIGYVRGIESEIRELALVAPEAKGLTDDLFACLDRFDIAGMARLLEPF